MHEQLYCLEQVIKRSFDEESYCIFQVPILAEVFFFLTPMVQEQNKLRMPVDQHCKFTMLSLQDIAQGVYRLSIEQNTTPFMVPRFLSWILNNHQKNQTLFQFTSSVSEDPSQMAHHMAKGLEKGSDFSFELIKPYDMRDYLKRMRDDQRFQRPLPIKGTFAHPLASYLSDAFIQMLLEAWDMANHGYLNIITHDLERALHHPPQDLIHFFQSNRDSFRQLQ
ncbi:hypothetical protein K492DRAFT_136767 [Lichtheimia hyalospora FSU 10163]|nr:hypothetical protein K492DRAFT_136767 [Lichtheimia hyalospora FSU 10163]